MSLYDLFLGGLETKSSQSLNHVLGKLILSYIDTGDQIKCNYYDGSRINKSHEVIQYAAYNGNRTILKILYQYDRETYDAHSHNGLFGAVTGGHKQIVKDFMRPKHHGYYFIMDHRRLIGDAARMNRIDIVLLFLQFRRLFNGYYLREALTEAILNNSVDIIELLIKNYDHDDYYVYDHDHDHDETYAYIATRYDKLYEKYHGGVNIISNMYKKEQERKSRILYIKFI